MRAILVLPFLLALIMPTVARSDDVPVLNVDPICRGIADQSATPAEQGGPDLTFKDCVSSEKEIRAELAKQWSSFAQGDKQHCVRLAKVGGESTYTELITCLEMARDVRALHSGNLPDVTKRKDKRG